MQHYTDNASVECVHDTNTSCDMSHHNATGSMDSAETNTGGWDNVLLVFLWVVLMCGLASVILVRRRDYMATIRPGALDRTHHNSLQDTTTYTRGQADTERKEHIHRLLVVKKVISRLNISSRGKKGRVSPAPAILKKEESSHSFGGNKRSRNNCYERKKSNLILDDDPSRSCPICLCEFKEKEEICWSNNPGCIHAFHHSCIEAWLLKHDECPCCRNNFLGSVCSSPSTNSTSRRGDEQVVARPLSQTEPQAVVISRDESTEIGACTESV